VDICIRSGAKIYPVHCSSDKNYMLTMKLLEDTLAKAKNEVMNNILTVLYSVTRPITCWHNKKKNNRLEYYASIMLAY